MRKFALFFAAGLMLAGVMDASVSRAAAPTGLPVIKAEPEAVRPKSAPYATCLIEGRVFCSEYGSRYKEPVYAVFTGGGERVAAPLGEKDGTFKAELPAPGKYIVSLEFQGKVMEAGDLELPDPGKGAVIHRSIKVYHPGSILELVWQIRDNDGKTGRGGNVDVLVEDPATPAGSGGM
jgi:hypothetical protein